MTSDEPENHATENHSPENHAGGSGDAPSTPGGATPEAVEDRPNVGTVTPDDYPDARKGDTGVSSSEPPPA